MTHSDALELDLSSWGATEGILAQTARTIASRLDTATDQRSLVELSRELRQLVKQIREGLTPSSESELDRFLQGIQAEGLQ